MSQYLGNLKGNLTEGLTSQRINANIGCDSVEMIIDLQDSNLTTETDVRRLHPYCETEDLMDADYLVIDDSDSEEEKGLKRQKQTDVVWKPVLKKDPYHIKEPLMLTLEEVGYTRLLFIKYHN